MYLILHFKCGMAIPTFLWGSINSINYPKADLWLQNEFVGCNLPVPITVRRTVADPVRGSGRGPDPPPSGLWLFVFYYLFDPESFASVGSHITIQRVHFSLKRAVPFGTIKFQAYLKNM